MSSSRNDDIPTSTIIDLIKANARALYGRHLTYDVITTAPKPPKQWHPAAKHDGQKAHALLVGYDSESPSSGIVLQGAFSVGVSRTPPTVGFALRILYDELTVNLEGFVGKCGGAVG